MTNHDQLYHTLEIWLSTGGMLASSVPALSLMIVYGGSVAATNLAGKMTSGASTSVNPSRLMSEPATIDSSMKFGGMAEYSPNTGAAKSGMADIKIEQGKALSKVNSSARESSLTATNTLGQTTSNIIQATQRSGEMQSNVNAQMSGFTSSNTSGSNWSSGTTRTSGDGYSLTNAEAEVVSAGAAVNAPTTAISAGLEAKANTSATRAKEISDIINKTRSDTASGGHQDTSTSGSSNTSSNQTFAGTEEMRAQAKQFTDQANQALSAHRKYSETSAMMEQSGKSMSFEGHQFGPMLNQAGMRPEINQANEALKDKIGSPAYQQLRSDAYYEIARSASGLLNADDRDALAGYLVLEAGDPLAAAEIFNKAASPTSTSSGSGEKMSPDQYKAMDKSPNDIVSQDQADGYRAFAHEQEVSMGTVPEYQGQGSSRDGIDVDVGGGAEGAGGSAAIPPTHHVISNSVHGSKQQTGHTSADSRASSGRSLSSRYSLGKDGDSKIPKRDSQPRNIPGSSHGDDPNKVREGILSDTLLRGKDVHAGKMLENAAANQINATADVAKHVLNSNPLQQSLSELKDIGEKIGEKIGLTEKKGSGNKLPHVKDDNDLPPTPKD